MNVNNGAVKQRIIKHTKKSKKK